MNGKFSTLCRTAVIGLLISGVSLAQNSTGDIQELKKEIQGLKNEVKAMRGDLTKAIAAMKSARPAARPQQPQRPAMSMIGKKPRQYTLTTVDGKPATIGGKRDKPQVVFCYASWCHFCKKTFPWMEELHKKYESKGVQVLALNLDARGTGGRSRTEEQTLTQFQGLNFTMPMAMTTSTTNTAQIGADFKARSFPTLFVMGQSGEVEAVHIGAVQGLGDSIGKELDVLLAGKNRTSFPK